MAEEQQTCDYWRAKYEETKAELDEFTSSSGELEQELDRELQSCHQTNNLLHNNLRALTEENRLLKEQELRNSRRIEALEDQVKNYDGQKQSLLQYRRELEQKNDELETSYRNLTASLSDHAKRIEALIEEKALLENELEQTRGQKEVEQRLRDELKDLRDELSAKNKAEEARQIERVQRRRTLDQNFLDSNNEINRLQAIASGDFNNNFTSNGHDNHTDALHKACKVREAELTAALNSHTNSKNIIQNLLSKISSLETRMLNLQRGPKEMPSVLAAKSTNGYK